MKPTTYQRLMMAREEIDNAQSMSAQTMLLEEIESIYSKVHSKQLFERTRTGMIEYLKAQPFFADTDLSTHKDHELERLCITTAAKTMERDEEIQAHHDSEFEGGLL
jgi:hypothetical protein